MAQITAIVLRYCLQKAKDILEQCDNVAPSTKGCYSSRIALWLHYCNKHLNGDDRVTEVSLTNYVEWMVVSGAAESIRQGATHIQQVLRNQLQGVMCYWRLQNKHNSDAQDPRQQQLFNEKWQMLIMRYPQPRHARRTEPIYGARRMSTPPSGALETSPKAPNTVSRIGYMQDNSPPRAQAIGMRQPHIMPNGAPARTVVPTSAVSNILGIAAGQPQHTGSAHMGYTQPAARQLYPKSPRFGSHPAGHQILHAQHPYTNGNAGHPQDMSPRRPSQTTSLAPLTSRTPADYPSRPSLPPSMQSLAPLQGAPRPTVRPLSQQHTPINGASDALAAQRSGSHQSLLSDTGAQQMYGSHKLDGAHYSRPASAGVSSQLDATLVSAPASPKPKALAEKARPGVLPEELPVWEGQKTPEGHLLNANEALALSIRLLGAKEGVETQVHAHSMLGLATWIPEVTRSALTLADLSIDKTFGTEPRAQNGDTAADKIDAEAGPEQPSLKAITISLKDGKVSISARK
ncbi:hypothetical protein GGF43_000012 [Coemansia sp. RSA 2618]|nr:hypothetical protein GGF43_000012 [Coemansia sp. RSA 2618]